MLYFFTVIPSFIGIKLYLIYIDNSYVTVQNIMYNYYTVTTLQTLADCYNRISIKLL